MSTRKGPQNSAARRERYLAAARELFTTHGYAGTTMDMIVSTVGGSKATLYKYYPDKESLVAGVIANVVENNRRERSTVDLTQVPLRDALTRLGRVTLDTVVSDDAIDLLRLALGEVQRFPALARALWESGPANAYSAFATFIEARREVGELHFENTQLACEHFLATIAGHIQLKVALGIAEPPIEEERVRRVAEAVETFVARYGFGQS